MLIFEIILCVLLGVSTILSIIRLVLSIILPEKPDEVKGCYVRGHYDHYVVGSTVVTLWHSDE